MAAAKTAIHLLIATVSLLLFTGAALEQAKPPAPAPSTGNVLDSECFTSVLNISDCLTYVTVGSEESKPDKLCCPELAGLLESAPACLCYLLNKNNTESFGISIDMSRALKLPSACGVSTPSVSSCAGFGGSTSGGDGNTGVDSSGVGDHAFSLFSVVVLLSTFFVI